MDWFLFCPFYPGALQATRALMVISIILVVAGLGVACMGMKCTNCGGDDKTRKSRIAMTGGIIILIGCTKTFYLILLILFLLDCFPDFFVFCFFAFPQLCVALSPALGFLMTSSKRSTVLSPLSIPSKYMSI